MTARLSCSLVVSCAIALGAWAQEAKPFQASLTPDVAVHDRKTPIDGLALNVWGENPQSALAVGFVNGSTGESSGLSLGFVANVSESYLGLQMGLVNYVSQSIHGIQFGGANIGDQTVRGAQVGVVNYAQALTGFQFGFVNYAKSAASGFQVGLVNLLPANETWFQKLPNEGAPGMVFVNWRL